MGKKIEKALAQLLKHWLYLKLQARIKLMACAACERRRQKFKAWLDLIKARRGKSNEQSKQADKPKQ